MIVMTVNAGSTSVRLAAFDAGEVAAGGLPHELVRERRETRALNPSAVLKEFSDRFDLSRLGAIAHRVVHGGSRFVAPTRIDAANQRALAELDELAPLHNPVARAWLAAARTLYAPNVRQVAVFDTAFFANLPARAASYAIPDSIGAAIGVRRYGFHGLAHEAMWSRWCEAAPDLDRGGRLITLQLGGGASVTAIERGMPVDTSMGFTPLEGLVMATRSGDIDPSIVPYLARRLGESSERVIERLNREAGLLGVSGRSSDMSELVRDPSARSRLAVELFCTRARKYVGAYLALMGGCDGIVFGGGIGEHVPEVRAGILNGMEWAGIVLDADANHSARSESRCLSTPASAVRVWVVQVDEEQRLARAAAALAA
jgi:acetate kinase